MMLSAEKDENFRTCAAERLRPPDSAGAERVKQGDARSRWLRFPAAELRVYARNSQLPPAELPLRRLLTFGVPAALIAYKGKQSRDAPSGNGRNGIVI